MSEQHWQDWLVTLIGVWLVVSNWVLGYAMGDTVSLTATPIIFWNALLAGIAALVLGVAALASFRLWEEWADIALGAWLVTSPWLLGFAGAQLAMWNVVICGVVIIASAAWTLYDEREAGHA